MKKQAPPRILVPLLAFSVLIPGAWSKAEEKTYDLKYRLKPGEEFSLLNMHISHQNQKTPSGMVRLRSLTRDLELNYRVVSADDGVMTLEVEYRKKLYRDTDQAGKLAMTDFAEILGKKARYAISPTGELSRFEGFKEMPPVRMPGGYPYTGVFLQEEIEHLFPTLPDQPIGKGGTWTRKAFGVHIEYTLIDEVKVFGHDCVRIFARIENEQPVTKRKDRNGNEVTIETVEPYTDIYYFAYKEGKMLYRFSVASNAQSLMKNDKGELINHMISDVLYETFVSLAVSPKRAG